MTEAAALNLELEPEGFVETLGGAVCALGLQTRAHRRLTKAIYDQLHAQLAGSGCAVLPPGEGVHVEAADDTRYAVPDAVLVCGEQRFHPDDADLLMNPTVLIEVTSTGTHKRDHVDKRIAYTALDSARAYLIVDQYQKVVTVWSRGESGWTPSITTGGALVLPPKLTLDLDAVYGVIDL